jgi:hypothetical protein
MIIILKDKDEFDREIDVVYNGPEIYDAWERFHRENYAASGGIGLKEFIESLGFKKVRFITYYLE